MNEKLKKALIVIAVTVWNILVLCIMLWAFTHEAKAQTYESDGYHRIDNSLSNTDTMALTVVTPRIDRLKADLNTAKHLVKNNSDWSKKELNIALFAFCYAKASEDIMYQLSCMTGRHDDIVNELEDLIKRLEVKDVERIEEHNKNTSEAWSKQDEPKKEK